MSNKRKLSTILGVAGATVLAAGGSIFLTDTGLSLIDKSTAIVQEPQTGLEQKETEVPVSVEQFAKTKDLFTINAKKSTGTSVNKPETNVQGTANQGNAQGSGIYASGNVNVRDAAGMDSEVLGTLAVGDNVTVVENREDGWTEISYNGRTGYVASNYLSGSQPAGSTEGGSSSLGGGSTSGSGSAGGTSTGSSQTSGGSTGGSNGSTGSNTVNYSVAPSSGTMYSAGNVNVRTGAGSGYEVITTLSPGESVSVTGTTDNGWIQISYNGQTGYVANNYLSWDKPSSSGGGSSNSGAWDDSYMLYDVNSRYISASELSGWSASDLATLRNEIFARHGRIFSKQEWRNYFSQKTWYVPTYDPEYFDNNMGSFLNDYEWANLDVILSLEG